MRHADVSSRRFALTAPHIPAVLADVSYVAPSAGPVYNYMYEPPDGSPQHNCNYQVRSVYITDARAFSPQPSIHVAGFELWDAPTEVTNLRDDDQVRKLYYEECAELARVVTGGKRAYVFDHQVRKRETGRPKLTFGRYGDGSRRGGTVGVCGTCLDARGITDSDLIDGAGRGTMDQLTEWSSWADKVLVF